MKGFKIFCIGFVVLAIWFNVEDMTVKDVGQSLVDMGWGIISVLSGGNYQASRPSRALPPNQGDDSDSIQPIEELEDIE